MRTKTSRSTSTAFTLSYGENKEVVLTANQA